MLSNRGRGKERPPRKEANMRVVSWIRELRGGNSGRRPRAKADESARAIDLVVTQTERSRGGENTAKC